MMQAIYMLVPISLIFLLASFWAIRYAIRSRQFDDLDTAANRIILQDREERRQALPRQTPDEDHPA
jgi:cbb3-type cytochrome oxidase maturation protein